MRKLILTSVVFASLATAGVASADRDRYGDDRRRYDDQTYIPADEGGMWTVDREPADRRRGTVVLRMKRGARGSDLTVVASDPSIRIRMIEVRYRDGRAVRVRGRGAAAVALGALRRADQIVVDYVNRGRDPYAEIALVANDGETAYEYRRTYRRSVRY